MPNKKEFPDRQRLLEAVSFCPMSGRAYWKKRPLGHFPNGWASTWNKRYAGKQVKTKDAHGYLRCAVDKRVYPVHRLMWYVHNGAIPDGMEIDHINGNRQDNRLQNLRLATDAQNGMNRAISPRNKSGATGVYFHSKRQKWASMIRVDRKLMHLAYSDTFDEAVAIRRDAEQKYFGEYARKN